MTRFAPFVALGLFLNMGAAGAQTVDDQVFQTDEQETFQQPAAEQPVQQRPRWAGRVNASPMPTAKVLRTGEDDEDADADAAVEQETAAAGSNETTDVAATGGIEVQTLPTVRRPGEEPETQSTDAADPSAADNQRIARAGDTDPGEEQPSRFKKAPPRKNTFDPNAASPIAPIRQVRTTLKDAARLRQLDKMTGTTVTYDVAVGQMRRVARLDVRLDACRSPKNNENHGTMAFLKIWDTKYPEAPEAFSGWMFAESPALSALDHPRYDVWVISCTTVEGEVSAGNE